MPFFRMYEDTFFGIVTMSIITKYELYILYKILNLQLVLYLGHVKNFNRLEKPVIHPKNVFKLY